MVGINCFIIASLKFELISLVYFFLMRFHKGPQFPPFLLIVFTFLLMHGFLQKIQSNIFYFIPSSML